MISKAIEGHFGSNALTTLRNQKEKFRWTDSRGQIFNDGPTMLKILVDICNPTVRVGVETYKKKIENTRLNQYSHNVSSCMESIVTNYNMILEQEGSHDNIIRDIFNALLSTTNTQFYNYFSMKKMAWSNNNATFTVDELTTEATSMHTNMVTNGDWNKVDPKDAQIMALTTKVQKLEGKGPQAQGDYGKKKKKHNELDPRRAKYKGASININGETLWWCEHHKNPSKFPNGLCMPHKPEDHNKWADAKKEREAKYRKGKKDHPKQELKLQDSLKAVLMTNYAFSEDMADSICQDTQKNMEGKDF